MKCQWIVNCRQFLPWGFLSPSHRHPCPSKNAGRAVVRLVVTFAFGYGTSQGNGGIMKRVISVLSLSVLWLVSASAMASAQFTAQTTQLYAKVGTNFQVDLTSLLSNQGSGNLIWYVDSQMPPWLNLNHSVLSGTPKATDVATVKFSVTVSDTGQTASITVTMHVTTAASTGINMGTQSVGQSLNFAVRTALPQSVSAVGFQSSDLPFWMSLDTTNGILIGTPGAGDVGSYSFHITVALSDGTSQTYPVVGVVQTAAAPPPVQGVKFTSTTLTLPRVINVNEYVQIPIKNSIVNPTGLGYTITITSGPDWLNFGDDGALYARPTDEDAGDWAVNLEITSVVNGKTVVADTELDITVQ
jgi:hypothetical protein